MTRKSAPLASLALALAICVFLYNIAFWDNFIDITLQQALVKTPFECRFKVLLCAELFAKTKQ